MSWSFQAVGRPAAVAAKVVEDLARSKCNEPEESIKNSIAQVIAASLKVYPETTMVEVTASGSQSVPKHDEPFAINSLNISIKPLWNWVG